jgi:hypothetical protein
MSQNKKQRTSVGDLSCLTEATAADHHALTLDDLSVDVLANIFRYLGGPKRIMCQRGVCNKWKEAVKRTIIPPIYFNVDTVVKYNAMRVMAEAMPNLQLLMISGFGWGRGHKWSDGEDPDEEFAEIMSTYTRHTHDIEIISNFSKLCRLEIDIDSKLSLNGRYPVLFNSFPLLEKLSIRNCNYLKWDLGMLGGLPLLKEFNCEYNYSLTGNISSLRVLKDTLEKVTINDCDNVEGNFMDLADFPHLEELDLDDTGVTGDIRDIGENGFSMLERLALPKGVYGGWGYEFQRISDGPEFIRAVYLLEKQRPALKMKYRYGRLSEDSPDWYNFYVDDDEHAPPFYIHFVEAGSRLGYQWDADGYGQNPCEVNWLDPEPDRESSDFEEYMEELQRIERQVRTSMCQGFHQPPTEEEYHRLLDEHARRG